MTQQLGTMCLIFQNCNDINQYATTHLKQESNAFSASKMSKRMLRHETNFGVIVTVVGIRVNRKQAAHGSDGEYLKHRIRMGVVRFLDGTERSEQVLVYHPEGPEHPNAGLFKGCVRSYKSMESTLSGGKPSVVRALLIVLGRKDLNREEAAWAAKDIAWSTGHRVIPGTILQEPDAANFIQNLV
ncbi:hypothetical protein BD779DRAFT_1787119 [Infundibulicybe gibba]|nr:hypothetical protein BD779DRAFT_1787119 [Infundibulicybe gibba]